MAKIPIQETRLFFENYSNHDNLNNLIMTEIETARKEDPKGMPAGNPGCWRSMYRYKCEKELYKPIGLMLGAWMDHYFPNKKMDATVTYWTNVNEPGSNNLFHSHYRADADVSGVYYVQGTRTGTIRFATNEQINKMIKPGQPYANMMGHAPHDGDCLIWPSYLLHDVDVNRSKTQRISIAFNVSISYKVEDNVIPMPDKTKKDPGKEKVELNQENIT